MVSAAILWTGAADAQVAERPISNPRVLGEGATIQGMTPFSGQSQREKSLELDIVYTDGFIYNPATGQNDKVRLRSYNGTEVDPTTPYVSPTIEVKPGDTVRITLKNQLPADPGCGPDHKDMNKPHCFNGTNLHTHGLWVNPEGNGDNVLLSISPGVSFPYEYNIPSDHPAGTFWYHTHRHGSTALQVSSGMAGALIIRGDRLPTSNRQGDLDTLLQGFPERVLVFQQIQYACRNTDEKRTIKTNPDGSYRCDPSDVGGIEGYDQFGPNSWGRSGRYTSINGQVIPTFKSKIGQPERWRMIHGGVRDTISLKLVKMKAAPSLHAQFTKAAAATFLQQSCTGPGIPQHLVAADGLTMAAADRRDVTTLQPGYRFDAMMVFPEAGQYCLFNASAPTAGSVNGEAPGPELLGIVDVEPGSSANDVTAILTEALVAKAQAMMPASMAPVVVADLRNGLKLSKFTAHADISDAEVTGQQQLTFFINTAFNPPHFGVSNTASEAEAEPYDPKVINRQLVLGGVDEWTLRSAFASHPFHIHVNPFQIVSILDPNGRDVSIPGSVDDADGTADPQYVGLKGVWKDTLWIKSLVPGPGGLYTIKVRTRYQRYIGKFVLHCHILDHEDQGMMQNVEIVLPGGNIGAGGQSPAGSSSHKH